MIDGLEQRVAPHYYLKEDVALHIVECLNFRPGAGIRIRAGNVHTCGAYLPF